jgi:hypothetical protein
MDGDGDLDVVVGDNHGRVRLLENIAPDQGRSALILVRDENGAPAVGAQVRVYAGERTLVRWAQPAFSYCSSSDPRAHFGLGDHEGTINVEVLWSDGQTLKVSGLSTSETIELSRE